MKQGYIYAAICMAALLSSENYGMASSVARRATGAASRAYATGSNAVNGQMRASLAQPRSQVGAMDMSLSGRMNVVDQQLQPSIDYVRSLKAQLQQAKELSAQMAPAERTAGDYDRKIEALQERVRQADEQLLHERIRGLAGSVDGSPAAQEEMMFESRLLE